MILKICRRLQDCGPTSFFPCSWSSKGACTILECQMKSVTIAYISQYYGTCREGKWKNLAASFPYKCNYLYCGAARFFDFSQKKVPLMNHSTHIFLAFLIPCMILSTKSLQIMPLKSSRSHINLELEGYVTTWQITARKVKLCQSHSGSKCFNGTRLCNYSRNLNAKVNSDFHPQIY